LESVGEKFALTRERIRQIEKKELDTISNGLVRNQEWIPSTVKEWFANESE
jgi:DNA-directed RNA polymerase sigma subunit (sigma70/sigma32)